VVYRSTNSGHSWGAPTSVMDLSGFDMAVIAADTGNNYPGHVYAAWSITANTGGPWGIGLTRSSDHGTTWHQLSLGGVDDEFSGIPVIAVAPSNGNIYLAWLWTDQVLLLVSKDGGDTFLPAVVAASGISVAHGLSGSGGNFDRGIPLTMCAGSGDTVAIAWPDLRQGESRIYYAVSPDAGASWMTSPSGDPLMTGSFSANMQHFQPQLTVDPGGVIGCAFYEFGPKPAAYKIDTRFAWSTNGGLSFSNPVTVTDRPWDPAIDAPAQFGNTSIGNYFGLAASSMGFYPLWTDTRTGIEELFTDVVKVIAPVRIDQGGFEIVEKILFGIVQDGGGAVKIGRHVYRVPPRNPDGPIRDMLYGLAIQRLASQIRSPEGISLQKAAMNFVASAAIHESQQLEGSEVNGDAANLEQTTGTTQHS
jgi:hypothetical protein